MAEDPSQAQRLGGLCDPRLVRHRQFLDRAGDYRELSEPHLSANDRAIEPQAKAIYEAFGLNDRQIEIIARATPKRDYYYQSRQGNRLFELDPGPVTLAFVAASTKQDHALMDELLAAHGEDAFAGSWLRARSLDWAAELIAQPTNEVSQETFHEE